jgi:signal transduction histidine kinase
MVAEVERNTPAVSGLQSPGFSVDTHLFTELGELLVGRDSTALVELVKNAYDADARSLTVFAENLSDPDNGVIRVVDDGVGMTHEAFLTGFLRVAGQGKGSGDRRSQLLGRRFTGAKGIGRFAAQKLARLLIVDSLALTSNGKARGSEIHAVIDWDEVEKRRTIDELEGTGAITVETHTASGGSTGTSIELRRLRSAWSTQERNLFLSEMQAFQPPAILRTRLPASIISKPLLFADAIVRDSARNDLGMRVEFEGDFALAEDYLLVLAEHATWILEIEARRGSPDVDFALAPTAVGRNKYAEASRLRFKMPHPHPESGPFFQARILCREGPWPRAVREANMVRRSYGVRVYLEGFRVLPYGEPGNDWLQVDAQYTNRGRNLPELATFRGMDEVRNEGLVSLPSNNYFGAVFLVSENAPTFRMLVNREGFVPDPGVEDLHHMVRAGLDLLTRARARVSLAAREKRRRTRMGVGDSGLGEAIGEALERSTALAGEAKMLIADGDAANAISRIAAAVNEVESIGRMAKELITDAALIRVLASLGTQMAAFIHETNGLLGAVATIEAALDRLEREADFDLRVRRELGALLRSARDVRERLERHAAYLTDMISADSRRRRIKMSLANRFDAASRLFIGAVERGQIRLTNELPDDLASPPLFPAELMAVFTNLLSNAIKAAGNGGSIRVTGKKESDGSVRFRLENTGERADLTQAEKWFAPYESSSATIDSAMGQGMGLGLTITRALLGEYGAQIGFVPASDGFATAVEVLWPGDA